MLFNNNDGYITCDFINEGNGTIQITLAGGLYDTIQTKAHIHKVMLEHGFISGYDYTLNKMSSHNVLRPMVKLTFVHQEDFTIMKLKYG